MPSEEILRRDGYGPTSPVIGRRGAHTRQRITDETLRQFDTYGFHATSVDSVAKAVGISRPTLYQYFESKQQIFRELLDDCGRALNRLARRIGPLGPTRIGFDNLHWWLGEWADIYDKYATVHVQWANMDTQQSSLRPAVDAFMDAFYARIARRLTSSGLQGIDSLHAAICLTSTVHRYHYFLHGGLAPPCSRAAQLDGLAVCLQLMLFPDTPSEALAAITTSSDTTPDDISFPLFAGHSTAVPVRTRPDREVGPRGEATRRKIIEAGARLFTERGYHETNVDDLVADLGLGRGTFYKYFPEKIDLLLELATECAATVVGLTERFAKIEPTPDGRTQLRDWLIDYLPVHARYLGVIRAWLAGSWNDPRLIPASAKAVGSQYRASLVVLKRVERSYPFDPAVAATVLSAMLERLPDSLPRAEGSETAELMATMIERAMFSPGRPPSNS